MSALKDLESVGYRLEGDPNAATLVWLPQEVSIGTNVVRPSIGLYGRWRRRPQVRAGRPARPQLAERPRRPVAQQPAARLRVATIDEPVPAVRRRPAILRRARPAREPIRRGCLRRWRQHRHLSFRRLRRARGSRMEHLALCAATGRLRRRQARKSSSRPARRCCRRRISRMPGSWFPPATIPGMPRHSREAASPPRSITG